MTTHFLIMRVDVRIKTTTTFRSVPGPESFYGSPPDFSLTKSPVLKPDPGRISSNTVLLTTSMSSFDSPLQPKKYINIFSSWHHSSCRAAMKRLSKKIAGLGGAIVVRISRHRIIL